MNLTESLKHYFETTPPEKIQSDWDKSEQFDKFGVSVEDYLTKLKKRKMQLDETKLICIKEKESNTWLVYANNMNGLMVQVEDLKDAPAEMAKSYQAILEYGFSQGIHKITEFKQTSNT